MRVAGLAPAQGQGTVAGSAKDVGVTSDTSVTLLGPSTDEPSEAAGTPRMGTEPRADPACGVTGTRVRVCICFVKSQTAPSSSPRDLYLWVGHKVPEAPLAQDSRNLPFKIAQREI